MAQPRISLEQWQALVAIVEAGSQARAAERLHKTQSTVTYAVQRIESLLGVKAFDIQGRKAVLTPTGQLLYRRAKILLDEAAGAEAAAQRISSGWEAEIRIAMEHVFPTAVMFQCLERFSAESPHTQIELFESVLAGTAEYLTTGQADLAITPRVPPGFLGESLLRMRFHAVARPDHALHKLGRGLTSDDLRAHRHLIVRESGSTRSTRLSIEAVQRWTFSHMATSVQAARMGYGFAWLPEEKIREELASGALKPLPLREGGDRYEELYLVIADSAAAGPGVLRMVQIMRETVNEACALEASMRAQPKRTTRARSASARSQASAAPQLSAPQERPRRRRRPSN